MAVVVGKLQECFFHAAIFFLIAFPEIEGEGDPLAQNRISGSRVRCFHAFGQGLIHTQGSQLACLPGPNVVH